MSIRFKNVRWKNFLSTGNNWTEVPLDRHRSTLIVGENGSGKCLRGGTEVDIKFKTDEAKKAFYANASVGRERTQAMKATLKQIADFYRLHPEYSTQLQVDTRHGYHDIEHADVTAIDSEVVRVVVGNDLRVIEGSPDHLLYSVTHKDWVPIKTLRRGDVLETKTGGSFVSSVHMLDRTEDLYDLQVADVKEFYANGIVSHNSTMLDALSFGLFGKAHRNIKKDQLVNSINEKAAEIEVEFDVGRHSFRVYRGIRPNKFEIWQNGQMINQSANARDYQKYLEQSILKLNHKSFHQIVVLGSSSFIPFMQLPAHTRREVIEDLLDIQIFSKMGSILKEHLSVLKEEIKEIDYNVSLTKEKIGLQQKYIRDIMEMNDEQIRKKSDEIATYNSEIETLQSRNSELSERIKERGEGIDDRINELSRKREKVLGYKAQFEQQISSVVKEARFYEENDTCPTCTQSILKDVRENKLSEAKDRARELKEALDHANEESSTLESNLEELRSVSSEVSEATSELHSNNSTIERLQRSIRDTQSAIDELNGRSGDLAAANDELRRLKDEKESLTEKKLDLMNTQTYKQAASEMLKDSGIKTKVIREYLPVMNNLINKYLQVLDFFVSFHLDESFNESIRSRYRDAFNYASFSEGEKAKIDISLLLAWRQIARMKNSASTNLLIMDEVFDGSLDSLGTDALMSILNSFDNDTNTFIISHKGDQLDGKFEHKMVARKEHNFSTLTSEE